jgi:TRAP-type C4-dicarboxylate transport system substrate-binding protein
MRMLLGCLGLLCAVSAVAQTTAEEKGAIEARCAHYAHEDQVPEKELANYMQDCINALSAGQSEPQTPPTVPPQTMRD